jgi:hypothetical protein
MGLNVYPSENFDFVDSVQLPDLILDLFCIHCGIHWLLWIWLKYTSRFPFINTLLGGYRCFSVEQEALLLSCGIHSCAGHRRCRMKWDDYHGKRLRTG